MKNTKQNNLLLLSTNLQNIYAYCRVDKVYRDAIFGNSLKGMDVHYLVLSDESLKNVMDIHTRWLDEKIAEAQNLLTNTLTNNEKSGLL